MAWRMTNPCIECPFNKDGDGRFLRDSLAPGRWRSILRDLRHDLHFLCHMTTHETGNGSELVCAGSLDWQHEHGLSSNLERVMGRLEAIRHA